jgi:hypothetical protein
MIVVHYLPERSVLDVIQNRIVKLTQVKTISFEQGQPPAAADTTKAEAKPAKRNEPKARE